MSLLSWVEVHGALTHIPVAFLLAVPVFEIGAKLLSKPEWRIVSFWLLAGAVVLAVPTLATGWITANDLKFTGGAARPPVLFIWHRFAAFTTVGLALTLLCLRVRARDTFQGKAHLAAMGLALLVAGAAGATGFLGGRMVFGGLQPDSSSESTYVPVKSAHTGEDFGKAARVEPQLVAAGQKLFKELPCQSCHRMEGKGGVAGPELTHEAQRHPDIEWHLKHLNDPSKMTPGSGMPSFDYLKPQELKALASYLVTRK